MNPRLGVDAIVEDFRSRATGMMAMPPQSVGTGEMRVSASHMLRLIEEFDRLRERERLPAQHQDNAAAPAKPATFA